MNSPSIPQRSPFATEVKAGSTYFWCACGRSGNQPFCDGSHKVTEFTPLKYTAEKDGHVFFCGCKHSGSAPICDGTHNTL